MFKAPDGGREIENISNFDQIWYLKIFDVVYYEFNYEFSKFKMADRVQRIKAEKLPNLNAHSYLRFFEVANYESAFIFLQLKMEDPISRKKNSNYPIKINM